MTETTFTLDQLPARIQQVVIETWRNNDSFPWADEWVNSLSKFENLTGFIGVRDWSVGYPRNHVDFTIENRGYWRSTKGESDEWADEMRGLRLWKFLRRTYGWALRRGDCPLTGYCGDEAILKPIREAIAAHPRTLARTTLRDILTDCFSSWVWGYENDIEYWHSDECIREDIEAGEYRFNEDGEIVS